MHQINALAISLIYQVKVMRFQATVAGMAQVWIPMTEKNSDIDVYTFLMITNNETIDVWAF